MSETLDLGDNTDVVETPFKKVATPAPTTAHGTAEHASDGARVRIVLEDNDHIAPTGQFIGVNGRGYVLRPNEEVDVPPEILSVLDDAVELAPIIGPDARVVGWREKKRFPYRVVR